MGDIDWKYVGRWVLWYLRIVAVVLALMIVLEYQIANSPHPDANGTKDNQ